MLTRACSQTFLIISCHMSFSEDPRRSTTESRDWAKSVCSKVRQNKPFPSAPFEREKLRFYSFSSIFQCLLLARSLSSSKLQRRLAGKTDITKVIGCSETDTDTSAVKHLCQQQCTSALHLLISGNYWNYTASSQSSKCAINIPDVSH